MHVRVRTCTWNSDGSMSQGLIVEYEREESRLMLRTAYYRSL